MGKKTELQLKRKEAREEILALKDKIPSARILNQFGKAFNNGSLGYWLSNVVLLNLVLLGPWILIGLALDENQKTVFLWIPSVIAVEDVVTALILGHLVIQNMLDNIANRIIEKVNNTDDLSKLLHWLKKTWSAQNVSIFILFYCILWASLGVGSMSISIHGFVGFGLSLTVVLVGLLAGLGFYVPFWVSLLASNLKEYQYDINAFAPADSEIINDISDMLTKGIYILAAFFAIITLIASSSLIDQQIRAIFSLPLLLIAWIITTTQFLLTRSTLVKIANKAKWKTLNKLQTQMNQIEATGDLSNIETADKILRLSDIYDQIRASRAGAFDLRSLSTFFSQLMLPLLGLLLGNLDKVLALFH